MTDVKHGGLPPAAVETVAGLSAGTIATLAVHPLDIVKTRMQLHRSSIAPSASLTTMALLRSMTQTQHPIAALYRGLAPNVLGNATSWASFFFLKQRAERAIAAARHCDPSALTPADFFAASACAGAATQVITNPIWVLKTRMVATDRAAAGAYPSMWAGARRLLRAEGVGGFYRGLGVGLLGVSHGAVQFAVYEPAKRLYFARRRTRDGPSVVGGGRRLGTVPGEAAGGDMRIANEATVALSTFAKLVAGAVTYPLQVLRSRLQNYDAEQKFGRGITGAVRQLWREEGPRGFYRGLMPGVVRVLPATWVTFLVYENVRYYLPRWVDQD